MPWTHVLACWPHLLDHLAADFKYLDPVALRRFRGDREKMVLYLAQTHDLTVAEAQESLDDWLIYKGVLYGGHPDQDAA